MRGVSDPLDLSRGLEEVLRQGPMQGPRASERLPETTADLFPADEHIQVHLDRILHAESLESGLIQALKPDVPNKEILTLGRFNALLGEAAAALREMHEASPDPVLKQAIDLLQADQENKEMLNLYRGLLHQG